MSKNGLIRWMGPFSAAIFSLPLAAGADTLDVPAEYPTIQAAIEAAVNGDLVLVQAGTYGPIDFLGKQIIVQSSDGAEVTVIDAAGGPTAVNMSNGEPAGTELDGFTLTGGTGTDLTIFANPLRVGGGIIVMNGGDPTIRNCVITENHLTSTGVPFIYGAGAFQSGADVTFIDCDFSHNTAEGIQQDDGGGFASFDLGQAINGSFIRCRFIENEGVLCGAAVAYAPIGNSSYDFVSCEFIGNVATEAIGGKAAGLTILGGSAQVINCVFSGNQAITSCPVNVPSAVTVINASKITNCTFANNSGGGATVRLAGTSAVRNCVIWHNEDLKAIDVSGLSTSVQYSNVEGGYTGVGNINADPLFYGRFGADGVPGTIDDNLRLLPGSPSMDSGNDAELPADTFDLDGDGNASEALPLDLDGLPRLVDGDESGVATVDMGAYETPIDACELAIISDCNGNGVEDGCDILEGTSADCNANSIPDECEDQDFDGDGTLDDCDDDIDGDGVLNEADGCDFTPLGAPIQPDGTLRSDFDGDCDVDLDDLAVLQSEFTDPGALVCEVVPDCAGDANGDGIVDPLDVGYVQARFGCPVGTGDPLCDTADQNADGIVDPLDSGYVLSRFGPCP